MITRVRCFELSNPTEESLPVTFSTDPSLSPYIIKNIDGLGPVSANIATTNYVTKDGSIFQNARTKDRNLVFTIGFDANYSTSQDPYGEMRRELYRVLYPKAKIRVQFESTELGVVDIIGYVESFEPTIFSKDPDVQISILCPDPYFSSTNYVEVNENMNESGDFQFDLINPGNVETGFVLVIEGFTTPSYPLTLTRISPYEQIMEYRGGMYIQGNLMSLYFNTQQGYKTARWDMTDIDAGGFISHRYDFAGQPVTGFVNGWGTVVPGFNMFELNIPNVAHAPELVSLFFKPKYMGF